MPDVDVIVIGSGAAAAHAAYPLATGGASVAIIDCGKRAPEIMENAPDENFEDVRRTRDDQWQWFLGEDFSAIPVNGLTGGLGGGQVSGNRSYVVDGADEALPLSVSGGQVIQSLAEGGLAAAWGGTCAYLRTEDLQAMGLPPEEIERQYDVITDRIGISGPQTRADIQTALPPDHHALSALEAYGKRQAEFSAAKISVCRPHAAVLTADKGERRATALSDMEYWADPGKSVYRPQFTIDELSGMANVRRMRGTLVSTIEGAGNECIVECTTIGSMTAERVSARRVILAAGTVGSARIVLRSLKRYDSPVPFVGKPHVFSACMDIRTLGQAGPKERTSLCQLLVIDEKYREGLQSACAQLYSYRSLQLLRLLGSVPLPTPQALRLLSVLTPSLVIADIRFPAHAGRNTLYLTRDSQRDMVRITLHCDAPERARRRESWRRIRSALRKLGMYSVRNMELPEASSSHYAGTLPYAQFACDYPTVDGRGELRGLPGIFVADASVFRCLPALPHTLTIMANANRVGEHVGTTL